MSVGLSSCCGALIDRDMSRQDNRRDFQEELTMIVKSEAEELERSVGSEPGMSVPESPVVC